MAEFTIAVVAAIAAVGFVLFLFVRREIKTASDQTLAKLSDMLRKGHGYSDPSAAAVVTSGPSPVSGPRVAPEPASARVALQAPGTLPLRVVPVTRDDDPAHTRPTVVAPPPATLRMAPHAPLVRVAPPSVPAPSTVPRQSTDRNVRPEDAATRRHRVLNEATIAEGRRARGEDIKTGEPRVVLPAPPGIARALGARETMIGLGVEPDTDRHSEEELTRVMQGPGKRLRTLVSEGPASEPRPAPGVVEFDTDEIAKIDVMASERGITREAMLSILAEAGAARGVPANDDTPHDSGQ
jgi:hypothetical protein